MLQQLQEFINKCIKLKFQLGQIPSNVESILCLEGTVRVNRTIQGIRINDNISYHDLFSVESGLMEFVDRYDYRSKNYVVAYHSMSTMNSENKIKYFLDNALLPDSQND